MLDMNIVIMLGVDIRDLMSLIHVWYLASKPLALVWTQVVVSS